MSILSLRPWKLAAATVTLTTILGACSSMEETSTDEARFTRSGIGGRWVPAATTKDNGTGKADDLLPGEKCAGSIKPGAKKLGDQLKAQFKQLKSVGGYACRDNTAKPGQLSIHALGRALDLMTTDGDDVANHLVKNAKAFGIQRIIWNRTIWQVGSNGATSKAYSGPNPHTDHVHAEVNRAAGASGPGEADAPTSSEEEEVAGPTVPKNPKTPKTPTNPSDPDSTPDFMENECAKATDCDPSGAIACFQGMCEFGDAPELDECRKATDCDPSGAMACVGGMCDFGECTEQLFRLGVCE